MFSYQLPTRSPNQVVIVTDTGISDELCITLPNGESTYVKAVDVQGMLDHFENERDLRRRLLDAIAKYPTNALRLIVNGNYGKLS